MDSLSLDVARSEEGIARERELGSQRILAESNKVNRLATLAQLALEELGDTCPVCQQIYDRDSTRTHLNDLLHSSAKALEMSRTQEEKLAELELGRRSYQQELNDARSRLQQVETSIQDNNARRSVYATRLKDLGLSEGLDALKELEGRAILVEGRLAGITRLNGLGEELTIGIVRLGEQRRRDELLEEKARLDPKLEEITAQIAKMEGTHALAGRIIEGLRKASLEVTRLQIERVRPLFQQIYSRIDPHPTFKVTEIITELEKGKGTLRPGISDPEGSSEVHDPLPILSSSQLNSFAVSLFLALNLGLPSLRLNLTMLDDPLQSLDSINLLGLVDVLRHFREHRQLILSTHEARLVGLLQRKLRPVLPEQRMVTLFFDGWSREGPHIRSVETLSEPTINHVLVA